MTTTVIPILRNEKKQIELDTFGYTIVDSINRNDLLSINQLFQSLHSKRKDIAYNKLFTCIAVNDMEYKIQMHEGLNAILKQSIDNNFRNCLFSTYTFQIKGTGPQTELFVHQDWSHSNEIKGYQSYTLWLPLINTNEQNGTLYLVPGSHKNHKSYRGHGITCPIENCRETAKKYHIPICLNAGEILLFDTSILHYSPDNSSENARVSVMINVTNQPDYFSVFLAQQKSMNLIEEYHVPHNYFLLYNDFMKDRKEIPRCGKLVDVYKNSSTLINEKALARLYEKRF